MVKVKSTVPHTVWKWESKKKHGQSQIKTKWSEAWSESNQQVHIQPGTDKARQNAQRDGQSQIKKFTYRLEMREQNEMIRCMVRCKSTNLHTAWKGESKMEWSDAWSESNQQVHIQGRAETARQNSQMHGQSQWSKFTYRLEIRKQKGMVGLNQINKFTYKLEMRKQNGMVRGMVRVKSTSQHTAWKWESKTEWSEA